ncbi:hypothetical protein PV721_43000 [Streptomyces sp. MB09-01]|uniref:hypothetical protein n=1 Tax=Streptomyces sp. MB09-01 TaxID=3028666 RepID=UPI0029A86834|nr:hypothetical protein [Streptomyces sp. MB09-01]MDX3540937.1 hypothetical protein [Streptomyces sp. MB09-01]
MGVIGMTHRSRTHRLVLLSASAALAAGGVPASAGAAAAAPVPPLYVTAVAAMPAVEWVETTDAPSGITVELPGKATVRKASVSIDGKPVESRVYGLDTADGGAAFSVHDMPGDRYSLEDNLQRFLESYMVNTAEPLTSSDVRRHTVDGRPVLDARLTSETGDESSVGFTRLIADDDHFVQVVVFGPEAKEKALKAMQERLLDSLRIP